MSTHDPEHEPDLPIEDVEPLADDEMTDIQPEQTDSQDDPLYGNEPEVDDDA